MDLKKIILPSVITFVLIGFSYNASAQDELVPSWIKNTAGFWSDDQISDSEFISALQFLVEKDILVIPQTDSKAGNIDDLFPKKK